MIFHQIGDTLLHRARAAQPREDARRHLGADLGVSVVGDFAVLLDARLRLRNVVKKNSEREGLAASGTQHRDRDLRVHVDVALGMIVRGLLASDHRQHFGQDLLHQAGLDHDVHSARGAALGHQAHDFLADALGGNLRHHRRGKLHRGMRLGLDGEIQARGKTRGAHHAEMILGETIVGISDRADDAGA